MRAGVSEDALHLNRRERLRNQIVSTPVQHLSPEAGIGVGISYDHFGIGSHVASQVENVKPRPIGEACFGQDDWVRGSQHFAARVLQVRNVLNRNRKRTQHARQNGRVFAARRDEEYSV